MVRLVTQKAAERRQLEKKVEAFQAALAETGLEVSFQTSSLAMARTLELARQVADSNATVLIRGEIGTGKGRLARAIHAWSNRSAMSLGYVRCHGASAELFDAELFGSARRDVRDPRGIRGRISFCDGGTLLLDEVARCP